MELWFPWYSWFLLQLPLERTALQRVYFAVHAQLPLLMDGLLCLLQREVSVLVHCINIFSVHAVQPSLTSFGTHAGDPSKC